MAFGHDADCNAATAGAALGCRLGFKRLAALPQYRMPDRYVNQTRPSLPAECKVSDQVETLLRACERVILLHGGERMLQAHTLQTLARLLTTAPKRRRFLPLDSAKNLDFAGANVLESAMGRRREA
jgi:hypothetical protein